MVNGCNADEKSDLERNLETKDEEINDLKESAQKKDDGREC